METSEERWGRGRMSQQGGSQEGGGQWEGKGEGEERLQRSPPDSQHSCPWRGTDTVSVPACVEPALESRCWQTDQRGPGRHS